MDFDIVILTDKRYVDPKPGNLYVQNVLLEERLLQNALHNLGLRTKRVAWNDTNFDWARTPYAVFRSTWDYFDRYSDFQQWLRKTSGTTQFINSRETIEWNLDKHYLDDLKSKGIPIPKTFFIEPGFHGNLGKALSLAMESMGFQSQYTVLKPCIGGSGRHTYKLGIDDWRKYDGLFQKLIAKEAMIIQEFQENIVTQGEASLMLFNGTYSHAVLKTAKKGEFRVQDDYGGTAHSYTPSKDEVEFAQNALSACPELPLYARVDLFRDNHGELALAELELFEPELWFRLCPEAASCMAQKIYNAYFV